MAETPQNINEMKELIYKKPELDVLTFVNSLICTSPLSDDQVNEGFEGEYNL